MAQFQTHMHPSAKTEVFDTASAAGTRALGRRLAKRLRVGDCVALVGDLGAGKTVLVRGIAEGLGLTDKRMVSSPTFVLVQEYPTAVPLFHLDLYRLCDAEDELADLGVEEMLQTGVVLIEWADRAQRTLPLPRWQIQVALTGRTRRRFTLTRIE